MDIETMTKFSKREAIVFGWQTFWANWKFLIGLFILAVVLSLLPPLLADILEERYPLFSLFLGIFALLWQILISLGVIKIYLQLADGQPTSYSTLFSQSRLLVKFFLASVLAAAISLLGFFLLIIPGVILTIKLQFWPWAMVDQNLGPIEALKTSWKITKGVKFNLLLFNILLLAVTFLGLLSLGVGILVAIPVTQLVTVFVYRKLQESS